MGDPGIDRCRRLVKDFENLSRSHTAFIILAMIRLMLRRYVMTIAAGMAVQAKSGVSREDLLRVADMAMLIWPDRKGSQANTAMRAARREGLPSLAVALSRRVGSLIEEGQITHDQSTG